MFVNEEIGQPIAGQTEHRIVEVLNPAAHCLSIPQLDCDWNLTIAERTEVERLLSGFPRRRRLGAAARGQWRGHNAIMMHCAVRMASIGLNLDLRP